MKNGSPGYPGTIRTVWVTTVLGDFDGRCSPPQTDRRRRRSRGGDRGDAVRHPRAAEDGPVGAHRLRHLG